MRLRDFFRRRKDQNSVETGGGAVYTLPTPETMFALNTSAAQWMKEGDYAKHGFESQIDLVVAFTIVEILGASDRKISDKEISEIVCAQFQISPGRCEFLIRQAHKAGM